METGKTIQYILTKHFPAYLREHKQPLRVLKAIEPQIRCRTRAEGTSHYLCPEDGEHKEIHHSCRNKGCTVCGGKRKQQWLASQKERLLNCEHYHVVTTLPHEYQVLWLYNREWFIQAQFEVTLATLKDLLIGNRYQGKSYPGRLEAEPGFISTLHTWGRSLNLHPHIHTLVTAGGLTAEGNWKGVEGDYLLPVKQVKALYRGKFQSKIKALLLSDEVNIPPKQSKESLLKVHKALYKKEWSVRIQEKYAHGKGVLIYISRYLGSSPIKSNQIELIHHNKEVLFSYWSHRNKKKEIMRMKMTEFLKKYLVHQAQPRVHTVRYYGLYSGSSKRKREACIAELGKTTYQKERRKEDITNLAHEVLCSCCGREMRLSYVTFSSWKLKNPLYKQRSTIQPEYEYDPLVKEAVVYRPTLPSMPVSYNKTFERDKLPNRLI